MKMYASAIALVYHRQILVSVEISFVPGGLLVLNFFSAVSISSVVGASVVSCVFPFNI